MTKLLQQLHRSFLFAHEFAISQASIPAQILTQMQGSKEKESKNMSRIYLIARQCQTHSAQIKPEWKIWHMHALTTTLPRSRIECIHI